MIFYSCEVCGSPPTNIKMAEDDNSITFPCVNHAITSPSGKPCDGTIIIDKREAYAAKIAQEDCKS